MREVHERGLAKDRCSSQVPIELLLSSFRSETAKPRLSKPLFCSAVQKFPLKNVCLKFFVAVKR